MQQKLPVEGSEQEPDFDGQLNYQKVGYFQFDDNQSTDFQTREMKSVFLDVTTQYLKFVLYQPYQNRMNIFDQTGLVSVSVLGDPIITVDQQVEQYQKYGLKLPAPNLDQSRARELNLMSGRGDIPELE